MKKTTLFVLSLLFSSSLSAIDESSQNIQEKTKPSSLSLAENNAPFNNPNIQKLSLKNAWARVLSSHEGLHAQEYAIKRAGKMKLAAKLSFCPKLI